MLAPRAVQLVLLAPPLTGHVLLVSLALSVPLALGLLPVRLEQLLDPRALLPRLLALGNPLLLELLLQLAVERRALLVVRFDPERSSHTCVRLLLRRRKLVALMLLDRPLLLLPLRLGKQLLPQSRHLALDLVRLDAVVFERDLQLETLRLDAPLALVIEDALVGRTVGERVFEVGRGFARLLARSQAVFKRSSAPYAGSGEDERAH